MLKEIVDFMFIETFIIMLKKICYYAQINSLCQYDTRNSQETVIIVFNLSLCLKESYYADSIDRNRYYAR